MKQFLKNNFALILAFALPIGLIAVVGLSSYLPSLFLSTDYNFIYTSCARGTSYQPYRCEDRLKEQYKVVNNRLVPISPTKDLNNDGILDNYESSPARIFLHDTKKNESREIALEEARTMTLNSLLTSPDGITVSSNYDRGGGFFLFDSGSSYGYYLTKGRSKERLNLINSDERYYYSPDNFQFLGWVLPGRN